MCIFSCGLYTSITFDVPTISIKLSGCRCAPDVSNFEISVVLSCDFIALLLGEEFGKFTAFASILPTLPYFLEDLVLPSLLTTKPSVSHSLVVNVELMLAILQFSSYCLLICIALLLANKFGECASDICHIRRLQAGLPCLVLYSVLPCCFLMNLVNSSRFPD